MHRNSEEMMTLYGKCSPTSVGFLCSIAFHQSIDHLFIIQLFHSLCSLVRLLPHI